MNTIEIVANTYKDFINYEQWLCSITFFEKVDITIFCMENTNSYFYTTEKVGNNWLVVTNGEYTGERIYNEK